MNGVAFTQLPTKGVVCMYKNVVTWSTETFYRRLESSTTPGRDIWVSIRITGGLKLVLEPEGVPDLEAECTGLDLDCIALTLALLTGVETFSRRLSLPVSHQVTMAPFPCTREQEGVLTAQKQQNIAHLSWSKLQWQRLPPLDVNGVCAVEFSWLTHLHLDGASAVQREPTDLPQQLSRGITCLNLHSCGEVCVRVKYVNATASNTTLQC